jgi:hypothetical protein
MLLERWMDSLTAGWRRAMTSVTCVALTAGGLVSAAIILPILPVNSPRNLGIRLNSDLREEVGWQGLVEPIADIRDTPPAAQQGGLGILTGNCGEVAAIDLYGPGHGLPAAISGVNSYWQRGYGDPPLRL